MKEEFLKLFVGKYVKAQVNDTQISGKMIEITGDWCLIEAIDESANLSYKHYVFCGDISAVMIREKWMKN